MKTYIFAIALILNVKCCPSPKDLQQINTLINSAQKLSVANESANPDGNGDIITPRHSVGFSGSGADRNELFEENRKLTKTLEQYVAFNPNADTLFPGSLVQGASLPDGVLNPIITERNPLTITITDLVGSSPSATYSQTVADPTLGHVTDAIHQILNQNLTTDQPAKISYSETSISSLDEGFLKLGASFKWAGSSINGSFNQSSSTSATSLLIRFIQSYYTVSAEPPSIPTSYISDKTCFESFQSYAGTANPPTYISSITFGRELWMLIESNHSETDLNAALHAAFSSGFTSGSADLSTGEKQVLNESNIQILLLGGSGKPAVDVVSGDHVSGLKSYLVSGASYSRTSPGVAISYTVRYLKDNDVARVSSTTDYTIKTSEKNPEATALSNMRVTWATTGDNKDWDTQPVIELFDRTGRHVGHIDCCSSDRNGDDWQNGRVETRTMQILIPGLTNADLSHGQFSAVRNPHGNDDWDYRATVEFDWADGTNSTHACSGRNSCGNQW